MAGFQKIIDIHGIKMTDYDIFIETGLLDGENISSMYYKGYFQNMEAAYSIELSKDYIDRAYQNFPFLSNSNVKAIHGDSGFVLDEILRKNKNKKIIFWLDAHYSSGDTAKSQNFGECPILAELEAIKHLKYKPTIIIDDLGCFIHGKPYYYEGWPKIENLIELAKKYFDFEIFLSERDEAKQLYYGIFK